MKFKEAGRKAIIKYFPLLVNLIRFIRDTEALNRKLEYREALGFCFNGPISMQEGSFEPQETLLFEKLVSKFDMFVNIGANTGYYVCKAMSQGIDVLAFEPNQVNVNILLRNVEGNNFKSKFHLFPIGLSDQFGILPMYGVGTGASFTEGWAGQTHKNLVPISTFDATAKSQIKNKACFVLIDIEGAELTCLKGAKSLLESKTNNLFLVEITVAEHQPVGIKLNPNLLDTFELFFNTGFEAYTADTHLRKIEMVEIESILKSNVDTLGVRNFIFVKAGTSLTEYGLVT